MVKNDTEWYSGNRVCYTVVRNGGKERYVGVKIVAEWYRTLLECTRCYGAEKSVNRRHLVVPGGIKQY